ncbi:hypothetical protein GCM10010430_44600 [Kitasatospora cystarginea]|uniref:Uncharacterized protein n=1 Tax=Kitasatospora cystarginea TaxID=58350 RepID=A0ABN3EFB1_9ACTN
MPASAQMHIEAAGGVYGARTLWTVARAVGVGACGIMVSAFSGRWLWEGGSPGRTDAGRRMPSRRPQIHGRSARRVV